MKAASALLDCRFETSSNATLSPVFERIEAAAPELRDMDKNIWSAIVSHNEAIALDRVEPLDAAAWHSSSNHESGLPTFHRRSRSNASNSTRLPAEIDQLGRCNLSSYKQCAAVMTVRGPTKLPVQMLRRVVIAMLIRPTGVLAQTWNVGKRRTTCSSPK